MTAPPKGPSGPVDPFALALVAKAGDVDDDTREKLRKFAYSSPPQTMFGGAPIRALADSVLDDLNMRPDLLRNNPRAGIFPELEAKTTVSIKVALYS